MTFEQEFHKIHTAWMQQAEEEEQGDVGGPKNVEKK